MTSENYKVVFELSTIKGETRRSGPVPKLQGLTIDQAISNSDDLNFMFEFREEEHNKMFAAMLGIEIGPEDLVHYDIARDESDAISKARQRLLGQHYRKPATGGPSLFPIRRSNRDSQR